MAQTQQTWGVPGWYTDPSGRYRLRYHDGGRWTSHVFDAGQAVVDDLPVDRLFRLLPPAPPAVGDPPGPWGDALLDAESCSIGAAVPNAGQRPLTDPTGATVAWVSTSLDIENPLATVTQVNRLQTEERRLVGLDGAVRLRFRIPVTVFTPEIVVTDVGAVELGRIEQQTTQPSRFSLSAGGIHEGVVEYDGDNAVSRDSTGQPTAVISAPIGAGPGVRFLRPVRPEVRAVLLGCLIGWDTIDGTDSRSFDTNP